ncbi:MAG: aldolase, partial [Syntrophales bacterium]|nr:aldolase [Syntrophales bacterium]
MICDNIDLLKKTTEGVLTIEGNDVRVLDEKCLRETLIDDLIRTAVFAPGEETRAAARWLIRRSAAAI